jgi:hypothetical protein
MLNQSTIISMINHQVIFVTFVEEGLPFFFLGLLEKIYGKKLVSMIFE